MPVAAKGNRIEECSNELELLERMADSALEQFVYLSQKAPEFYSKIENIEEQLRRINFKQGIENDLHLNEITVVADKIDEEIDLVHDLAICASAHEIAEEWAEEFEESKRKIERLKGYLEKARKESAEGEVIGVDTLLEKFEKDAQICKAKLDRLYSALAAPKKEHRRRLQKARAKLAKIKAKVVKAVVELTKQRLRKPIAQMRIKIHEMMEKQKEGKIVLDFKRLAFLGEKGDVSMSLTEAVKYAFADLAPGLEPYVMKAAKGEVVLVGSYQQDSGGSIRLKIGERFSSGDAVIYKERHFVVQKRQGLL
ncbi:MAG: hypothetical protein QXN37_02990 [Candidatus Anstonellaceae archaeon]